jgi:hypothetical protein
MGVERRDFCSDMCKNILFKRESRGSIGMAKLAAGHVANVIVIFTQ